MELNQKKYKRDQVEKIVLEIQNENQTIIMNYKQKIIDLALENQKLKAEIEALKKEMSQSKSQLNDIKTEQQRLIAARGFVAEEGDIKSARLRVNRLVREIDKCILLLNE